VIEPNKTPPERRPNGLSLHHSEEQENVFGEDLLKRFTRRYHYRGDVKSPLCGRAGPDWTWGLFGCLTNKRSV